MRILVLTSRYTATRDIIGEDFGRQTRLFAALKEFNHNIDFFVADYRKFENVNTKLHGINVMIRPFSILYFLNFIRNLNSVLKNGKYDFLISTSDPLWGIIGHLLAKKHKVRFIYDLHDNYEIYTAYKIPFFKFADSYVLRHADIITVVSHALKAHISKIRSHRVYVVQNGFDEILFRPKNRNRCRKLLNLPKNKKFIVYAGSLQRAQGLHILIGAFNKLKVEIGNICLVLAGRFYGKEDKYFNLKKKGIIYLGSLTQDKIPLLINSADVAVVPNSYNNFTKYCFPYKVAEYMACNVPIVATKVGDVGYMLSDFEDSLCKPDDDEDLSDKIKKQLFKGRVKYRKTAMKNTWHNIAKEFDAMLRNNFDNTQYL